MPDSKPKDRAFVGADGKVHKPTDTDYWQAKSRQLEQDLRGLHQAIVDVQHRVAQLDGGELRWPADTYEPPYDLPVDAR